MKLSTRGRYGLRLMLELAIHYKDRPILLKDISENQRISLKYLGQLIMPLKIAGLVKSARGARGGYSLSRPPEKIKIGEIVSALEGKLCIVECIDNPEICEMSGKCAARDVWSELNHRMIEILNSHTLQDMVTAQIQKENSMPLH
jgi:Rrf2 family protein